MQKERAVCILQLKLAVNCIVNFHGELNLVWRVLSPQFQKICSIDYIKRAKGIITGIISGVIGALHFFCYLLLAGQVLVYGGWRELFSHRSVLSSTSPPPPVLCRLAGNGLQLPPGQHLYFYSLPTGRLCIPPSLVSHRFFSPPLSPSFQQHGKS